ncbi:hypothetical protein KY290_020461 [Solanum tuberosum]|uniref:MATH domain-containing protein n=1 Tax=Solanum tuberosum TaxID=4113 RepID=A0ABQ7V0P9_SOLTU|nr:hypothetical protein KY290_020461 [Solanum tuberosum]
MEMQQAIYLYTWSLLGKFPTCCLGGMERHFRNIKTEWGFSKCISHKTFKDPSNGYLVNDKCVVGVDVYVIKNQGIGECMSLLKGTKETFVISYR